jgi:hypothetical protein
VLNCEAYAYQLSSLIVFLQQFPLVKLRTLIIIGPLGELDVFDGLPDGLTESDVILDVLHIQDVIIEYYALFLEALEDLVDLCIGILVVPDHAQKLGVPLQYLFMVFVVAAAVVACGAVLVRRIWRGLRAAAKVMHLYKERAPQFFHLLN